jgi:hypothetical protein
VEVAENGLNVCVSGDSGVLSTTRVLVPIAFDAEPGLAAVPPELHAATPAVRATAATAARTLGFRDL